MRRGQITMFIIAGLVLLLITGIAYLAVRSGDPPSLAASREAASVQSQVEQCLRQTGQEAVRYTALRGGYYTMDGLQDSQNYESQVLTVAGQPVPYWHEIQSCGNAEGCIGDHRPRLCTGDCPVEIGKTEGVSWQESIERYIEDNIRACAAFEERGNPAAQALIRDTDVLLTLDYPVTVQTADGDVRLDRFSADLDVNLPDIYEFANELYSLERETMFVEEQFLHLLTIYAGIDSPVPPIRDAQLSGGSKHWTRQQVQQTLEEQVLPFLNFLQVANAMESYAPLRSLNTERQAYASGVFNYMDIKLDTGLYPLGVQFQYPYQDVYLDINGQEFLKGKELPGTDFLSIIGGFTFIEYTFSYDVTFPLIVKITDPHAFNGEGLDLYYAIEANVRNNRPVNVSADIVTFRSAEDSLDLSGPDQLVEHTYEVQVIDRRTDLPIPDAGILYVCGNEQSMGVTDETGRWTGRLPYCLSGGHLKAERDGYMGTAVAQENSEDDGGRTTVQIHLWPRQEKPVVLYKITPEDVLSGGRSPLDENESVILTIARQQQTPYDSPVPYVGILEFGQQERQGSREVLQRALENGTITQEEYDGAVAAMGEGSGTETVDLVPGRYDITGFLSYYGLIEIPEDERCDGNLLTRRCETLPAQNFTTWNAGGVVLSDDWAVEFTPEDVYGNTTLVLYVLAQQLPESWTDMENVQHIEDYQTYERRQMVRPEFR